MNEFLEKAMVFINENTMLLIGICIFLIIVLIGYLIDNAIKTRKLEKQEMLRRENEETIEPVQNTVVEEKPIEAPVIENQTIETPVAPIEPEVKEELIVPEVTTETIEEIKPEVEEINPAGYIKRPESETGYKELETEEKIIEPAPAPVKVEMLPNEPAPNDNIEFNAMEDLLNKDFSKNNEFINNMDESSFTRPTPNVIETKDEPIEKKEKSSYKNGKSLSDILGKKKEEPKLETTQDFSDELDKILSKLNEETISYENSLNDEDNFNNRF